MNYAIINNRAQFMPAHENYKIKALCDMNNVPYEAVEEIGINDEVMLYLSVELLAIHAEYLDTFARFFVSEVDLLCSNSDFFYLERFKMKWSHIFDNFGRYLRDKQMYWPC